MDDAITIRHKQSTRTTTIIKHAKHTCCIYLTNKNVFNKNMKIIRKNQITSTYSNKRIQKQKPLQYIRVNEVTIKPTLLSIVDEIKLKLCIN